MISFDQIHAMSQILPRELVEALHDSAESGRPLTLSTSIVGVIMIRVSPAPNPEQLQHILDYALLGASKQESWSEAAKYLLIWWTARKMWGEVPSKS